MELDLNALLTATPCWEQQQSEPPAPSSCPVATGHTAAAAAAEAAAEAASRSGCLLDQWLAQQACSSSVGGGHLLGRGPPAAAAAAAPDSAAAAAAESVERRNSEAPGEEQQQASLSSSVAWKLQLFKAAVGIKKKKEEFDARRRRSLLAFMNRQTQQEEVFSSPSNRQAAEDKKHRLIPTASVAPAAPAAAARAAVAAAQQKKQKSAASYKWIWGSEAKSAATDRRSSSRKPAIACCSEGQSMRRESVLRRFALLQRQQLLSPQQLRLLPSQLEIEGLLGEGASGQVWRVRHRESRRVYALKVTPKQAVSANSSSWARVYAERHLLIRSGVSSHLAKLHAAYQDEGHLFLLQELLPGPSLFSLLQARGRLTEQEARELASQLAKALHAVHRLGFIHRDVKTENLMFDRHRRLKLIDLGLAARPAARNEAAKRRLSPSDPSQHAYSEAASSNCCSNCCSTCCCSRCSSSEQGEAGAGADSGGRLHCYSPAAAAAAAEGAGVCTHQRDSASSQERPLESFACWRLRHLSERGARSAVGTLQYMAPEVAFQKQVESAEPAAEVSVHPASAAAGASPPYDYKADWWSFGAVLFECLFGHPPFARFRLQRDQWSRCSLQGGAAASREEGAAAREEATDDKECTLAFCQPAANPELLASMLRQWKTFLVLPPPPFKVRKPSVFAEGKKEKEDEKEKGREEGEAGEEEDRQQTGSFLVSAEAVDLLQNLLCEKSRRFGFAKIKRHPWFEGTDWGEGKSSSKRAFSPLSFADKEAGRKASSSSSFFCAPHGGVLPEGAAGRQPGKAAAARGSEEEAQTAAGCTDSRLLLRGLLNDRGGRESPSNKRQRNVQQRRLQRASPASSASSRCTDTSAGSACEGMDSAASGCCLSSSEASEGEVTPEKQTAFGRNRLPSWANRKLAMHAENKWLLDLRFLGFEFDRRKLQAVQTARRLRAASSVTRLACMHACMQEERADWNACMRAYYVKLIAQLRKLTRAEQVLRIHQKRTFFL
ncbi:hypothetical protein Efla_005869 [Eimeria flavescens]